MCILFLYNGACDSFSDYSLILLSNRDENYDRPTQNLAPWCEDNSVIGGRDLDVKDGGSWLAISPLRKKIGVLLNLMGNENLNNAKSRGHIVADYVKSDKPVEEFVEKTKLNSKDYNEFILITAEFGNFCPSISSYSNANDKLSSHKDTYLGFGNSLPEIPLKKVEAGTKLLKEMGSELFKENRQSELVEKLIALLKSDVRHLPDQHLKSVQPNLYEELSSIFVCIPQKRYGTRTHTIVLITKRGCIKIIELTQEAPINPAKPEWTKAELQFNIEQCKKCV